MADVHVPEENHKLSPTFVDMWEARTHVQAAEDRLTQARIDCKYYERELKEAMDAFEDAVRKDEQSRNAPAILEYRRNNK